jgi:hypothetical protein
MATKYFLKKGVALHVAVAPIVNSFDRHRPLVNFAATAMRHYLYKATVHCIALDHGQLKKHFLAT